MTTAMTPVTAAHPSPPAAPPAMTTTPVATMAVMPATMGNLLHLDRVIAFEDSRIRLVQLVENSVALGNTGNRATRSDHARKRHRPRNAQQSS